MFRRCCIPNCSSTRKSEKLHKFPKTEIGLNKWVQCINNDNLKKLSHEALQKLHVCHKHFENRMRNGSAGKSLHHSAYPSLFNKEELETGVPMMPHLDSENDKLHTDHNYSKKKIHIDHTYSMPLKIPFRESNGDSNNDYDTPSSTENQDQQIPCPSDYDTPSSSEYQSGQQIPCLSDEAEILIPQMAEAESSDNQVELHLQCLTDIGPSTSGLTPRTPKKYKRNRIVNNVKELPPSCRRLYKEYIKTKKRLEFTLRAKRAMKMDKKKQFEKLTKNLNPLAKKFFWLQIKQSTRQKKGRRYDEEEKFIALLIMKESPNSYDFLQKIFLLPSKGTLNKMIRELDGQELASQ